jgi:hypothetical protein
MIDITGQKFNRLTAIEPVYKGKNSVWYWKFKCDCGNEKVCNSVEVRRGKTKSCSCLALERNKDGRYTRKHGLSDSRLYSIHSGMKGRCYRKTHSNYKYYGGRGIKICDEWLGKDGFIHFYEWAINNGYKKGLTIDRIDVNKGYSPDNCRWTTRLKQCNNKRNNCYVTFNGITHTTSEWSKLLGFGREGISARLRNGWTIEEALTIPKGGRRANYKNEETNRG